MTKATTKQRNAFSDPMRGLTCQICGGSFAALEGYIARHGHKRIKGVNGQKGSMTKGCWGSRQEPYEVSRDHIMTTLAMLEQSVAEHTQVRDDYRDPAYKEYCRHNGIVIEQYANSDLDQVLSSVRYDGVGKTSDAWDTIWDSLAKDNEKTLASRKSEISRLENRYDDWRQTVSNEEWVHNRNVVMHPKRHRATVEGWQTRRDGDDDDGVVAEHPPMILRRYGEPVARFTTVPNSAEVFESIRKTPAMGIFETWEVIDTHPSWQAVMTEFADQLEPA